MELSDRLVAFLGKLDIDPEFQEFLTEFEPYLKIYSSKDFRIYTFNKLGFSFHYEEKLGGVIGLFFEILTRGVRDGDVTPFEALLPFGVATSDTRQEVQVKLGAAPIRSTPYQGYPDRVPSPWEHQETWWDIYNDPMKIGVIFRTPLCDMDLFSVHYSFSEEAFASFRLDMVGANQQDDRQQLSKQLRARTRSRRSARRTHRQPKQGIGEITKRLDDLIEMRNALASIEDDEQLSKAFDEFMVVQSSIIDSVFPILDRLSDVGALLLEYHQNDPGAENKQLNFWSGSGYQIVRGYKITGTRFDTISDPPPDLVSELAGEDGFLPPYENEPD